MVAKLFNQPPQNLPAQVYPEIMLQASLDGANFLAKLDLLAVQPGERLVIVDWKTGLKKPSRAAMRAPPANPPVPVDGGARRGRLSKRDRG
jgi:hypothetical protein